MNSSPVQRSVALTFRGFELSPKQVELLIGQSATERGVINEPVKPGVKALLKRSYVRYEFAAPNGCRLDEMIPLLFSQLGGGRHLMNVKDQAIPEIVEVDIVLYVKKSEEQEGGFLTPSSLFELSQLGAKLSFQFL